ncbi:TM0106 family RecB-like putative nuclease [Mariniblastus fucicola]|uniref:Viral (Superfamily 1) RNA helicase n=1 Tax=Mariniblastus fucicola TaxID=980251 RepID=A0A5B9PJE2_9BACT|nr:TM0106 family RecB-like putative nuclease [Mariniblastus fucicola]QEG24776.1 Viral (Superfamily 1) RNA helicase [Mariniblastus fucicola]
MKKTNGAILFSATDLANHLACSHTTQLNRQYVDGDIKLEYREDPMLDLLIELGENHEQAYLEYLKGQGLSVVELKEFDGSSTEIAIKAMREGVDVIAQAWLSSRPWRGRTDFLIKVDTPSDFGDWSYEVSDTKLSQITKSSAVIQLCLYSEMLAEVQGVLPNSMSVVKPGDAKADAFEIDRLRVTDYMAYFRMAKSRFEAAMNAELDSSSYPEPCDHCKICNWWPLCNQVRRNDDHLSFVAGMTKSQRVEVVDQGISKLTTFAEADKPLCEYPKRGAVDSYNKSHRQAQIQLKGIRSGKPEYEFNEIENDRGFLRLPEPCPGDIFFDIEGNPRAMEDGLEYLFGYVTLDEGRTLYRGIWGLNKKDERKSFEQFIDCVLNRWEKFPEMHIYHFAPYEPSALKRLSLRHATRETELDDLLRGEIFVDLYGVTRQGIRASVESYSIKQLEQFYGFERAEVLEEASKALREVERLIELNMTDEIRDHHKEVVENYNKDDCLSTLVLRDWLETLRSELAGTGVDLPRPPLGDREAKDSVKEMSAEAARVFDLLAFDIEDEPVDDNQSARWLLAHTLEYFRREEKCMWWDYFTLKTMEYDELLRENRAIAGLGFVEERQPEKGNLPIHVYEFPIQDTILEARAKVRDTEDNSIGSIKFIDIKENLVGIKKAGAAVDIHPSSVFEFDIIPSGSLPVSLLEFGEQVANAAKSGKEIKSARYDLLAKKLPRLKTMQLPIEGAAKDNAISIALDLDNSYLGIQGPPGTGKTFVGSHVISELAKAGKRIGVCAVGHTVIINLLKKVHERCNERGISIPLAHCGGKHELPDYIKKVANKKVIESLDKGCVVGGTAWLWSSEPMMEQLDYLFIDEAGQMSLAMALAAGRAAKNIILLGDPQQLEQPQQALHPEGAEISSLAHVIDGNETMPPEKGLFLETTWRLHPKICGFNSEQFYENRLQSLEGLELQEIFAEPELSGNGLRFFPVEHEGNQNRSFEEVEFVCDLYDRLLSNGDQWATKDAELKPLTHDDILVIAPFNAQVSALKKALPDDTLVGTVDKFQGQEAAIVIYSMTCSSAEVAPRGMSFLYDRHRLNVATSRARALAIVVGSPALLNASCNSPAQMRLANALCRFHELSESI